MKNQLKQWKQRNESLIVVIFATFFFAGAIKFLGQQIGQQLPSEGNVKMSDKLELPADPKMLVPKGEDQDESLNSESSERSQKIQLEKFERELSQLLESLPTKDSFSGLTDETAHEAPEILLQAALRLAKVTDRMSADASLKPLALKFYQRCASLENGLPSIQAVCLKRSRQLSMELQSKDLDVAVNLEVEHLAW